MKSTSIVAIASDAGGARALLPVLEYSASRGHSVTALLSGPAAGFAENLPDKIQANVIEDHLSPEDCKKLLTRIQPQLLFSACGLYNTIEYTMRMAAHQLGTPILGMLDSWHNYRERFERPNQALLFPDWICAIDETSMQGMIDAGFPSTHITITGHPDLEQTSQQLKTNGDTWRNQVRMDINHRDDHALYVFLSDPFYCGENKDYYSGPGAIMHEDGSPLYGYTTEDILPATAQALAKALEHKNQHALLVIRPHPSEWKTPLYTFAEAFQHNHLKIRVEETHSTPEWLAAADAVIGMMTIALLHSAFLNRPTLSVQIGLTESGQDDPGVATQLGYIPLITNSKELHNTCQELVKSPEHFLPHIPTYPIPLDGSTKRVYQAMKYILTNHHQK